MSGKSVWWRGRQGTKVRYRGQRRALWKIYDGCSRSSGPRCATQYEDSIIITFDASTEASYSARQGLLCTQVGPIGHSVRSCSEGRSREVGLNAILRCFSSCTGRLSPKSKTGSSEMLFWWRSILFPLSQHALRWSRWLVPSYSYTSKWQLGRTLDRGNRAFLQPLFPGLSRWLFGNTPYWSARTLFSS